MAYDDTDQGATATVAGVISRVHRRTARMAQAQAAPAIATTEADEDDLRRLLRRVTRRVATRTGRVMRRATLAVSAGGAVADLPRWAAWSRLSAWYVAGGIATVPVGPLPSEAVEPVPLDVRHGVPTPVGGDAPAVLFVGETGALTLRPVAASGALLIRAVLRAGLAEADHPDDDAFEAAFPDELAGAVADGLVAAWLRELGLTELAQAAEAEMEADLDVFGSDATQTGFALPSAGRARRGRVSRRRRR